MTMRASSTFDDDVLRAAKRERQEESRRLVQNGVRSQESMFLIPPVMARNATVRHRTKSF